MSKVMHKTKKPDKTAIKDIKSRRSLALFLSETNNFRGSMDSKISIALAGIGLL
ncbi:hypothetical protein OAT06_05405 [Nitrospinaceae bacterium]|nr:hypothetical protein [Nitrospinaceae bacterium]